MRGLVLKKFMGVRRLQDVGGQQECALDAVPQKPGREFQTRLKLGLRPPLVVSQIYGFQGRPGRMTIKQCKNQNMVIEREEHENTRGDNYKT